jgi:hypothetical protein
MTSIACAIAARLSARGSFIRTGKRNSVTVADRRDRFFCATVTSVVAHHTTEVDA